MTAIAFVRAPPPEEAYVRDVSADGSPLTLGATGVEIVDIPVLGG